MKKKLLISFSGGATSGYMLKHIIDTMSDQFEFKVVFANTGLENEKTLQFVRDVAINWNLDIIWVEGYPRTERGWGVDCKIVTFETASRAGEPFEAMISKLGIPSTNAPFCSDQLKRRVIERYLRLEKWRMYYKAIGIRADEIDRINENHKELRILYPLVSLGVTKEDVKAFWDAQSFKLDIHSDLGNCECCWKKDMPRLVRIAKSWPDKFTWWSNMVSQYGNLNPRNSKLSPPFNFYRGNLSVADIFTLAKLPIDTLQEISSSSNLSGCSESCEAF